MPDAPSEIQEAAALAFGGCFLLPSVRATSMLGHVGAGACAENPKVSAGIWLTCKALSAVSVRMCYEVN